MEKMVKRRGTPHWICISRSILIACYPSRIDFSTPSEGDLEKLALACDPATFGLNNNDVLDESYRKAGKMDISDVVSAFDVGCSALSQVIRDNLLDGPNAKRPFIFERYKLNVYCKSFPIAPQT